MAVQNKVSPDSVTRDECIRIHNMMDKKLESIENQQSRNSDKINEMHAVLTNGILTRVKEISDRNKWFFRLLVGMLLGFIVQILVLLLK